MRHKYYEDLYNNQYRWNIEKNELGYYHCGVYKYNDINNWVTYRMGKHRLFRKKYMAKAWCLKLYHKAVSRQKEVISAREERKQTRLDSLPKYTKEDIKFQDAQKNIERLKANIKRADTKMKTLTTRRHTYEKQIKVNQRRIEKLVGIVE